MLGELRKRQSDANSLACKARELQEKQAEGAAVVAPLSHAFNPVHPSEVATAWMKVIVKKALPLDLVDEPLFREAVALTAKCGSKQLLGGRELRLPHRVTMTHKVLPAFDAALNAEIRAKVKVHGMAESVGVTIVSDGWTNVQHKPIINALVSLPLGAYFLTALDTAGQTKDAQYIADFIIEEVKKFGPEKVVAVCMDGACTASFPLINSTYGSSTPSKRSSSKTTKALEALTRHSKLTLETLGPGLS